MRDITVKSVYSALIKIFIHRKALWKAGRMLKVPVVRLLKHDNSKFHPTEFWQYVRVFELGLKDETKWAKAWEHHWRHNDHHIEYWEDKSLTFDWHTTKGRPKPEEFRNGTVWMPDVAIREMIADWMAASYAYAGQWPKAPNWKWGNENLVKMLRKLEYTYQPETCSRSFAIQLLEQQGMITQEQIEEAMA